MPSSWTILEVVDLELHGPKHPAGPPMTLGNMRHPGVHRPVANCLNPACRHEGLIDVSSYADDVAVPYFVAKVCVRNAGPVVGTLM